MIGWPRVRGVLTTALAWALPWAVVGGVLFLSWGVLTAHPLAPLGAYFTDGLRIFYVGAVFGGALGAVSGGTFAALLARRERNHDLATLSLGSAARLGAISGATSLAVPMLIVAIGSPRSPFLLAPVALFAAAAGAASAYAMIVLARRALTSAPDASALTVEAPGVESAELADAHLEVERALSERHNLTTLAADERS